jgi:Fe2+ transport system protein FeoA
MVEGSSVEVKRVAPLGDPISVHVLGFTLCLRLAEAANVLVVPQS